MAAVEAKHAKVNPHADGLKGPTFVQPSDWNDLHKFTGGADGQCVTRDSTAATGASYVSFLQSNPVTSDAEIPINDARIVITGPPGNVSYALRYKKSNGDIREIASQTYPD
jgi:hypothetical protein